MFLDYLVKLEDLEKTHIHEREKREKLNVCTLRCVHIVNVMYTEYFFRQLVPSSTMTSYQNCLMYTLLPKT